MFIIKLSFRMYLNFALLNLKKKKKKKLDKLVPNLLTMSNWTSTFQHILC